MTGNDGKSVSFANGVRLSGPWVNIGGSQYYCWYNSKDFNGADSVSYWFQSNGGEYTGSIRLVCETDEENIPAPVALKGYVGGGGTQPIHYSFGARDEIENGSTYSRTWSCVNFLPVLVYSNNFEYFDSYGGHNKYLINGVGNGVINGGGNGGYVQLPWSGEFDVTVTYPDSSKQIEPFSVKLVYNDDIS